MISELNDDEILEFLMTSDFEESYSPGELKYLIIKFRYFYRLIHGRFERLKSDSEFNETKFNKEVDNLKNEIKSLMVESARKGDIIDFMKSRKLTLKERISGKIISKEDENK
jgi:hypothetical protein